MGSSADKRRAGPSIKALGLEPVAVELTDGQLVQIRFIAVSDFERLGALLSSHKDAREFTIAFLSKQIHGDHDHVPAVDSWSDEDLHRAVAAFAASGSGFDHPLGDSDDPVRAFYELAQEHYAEQIASAKRMFANVHNAVLRETRHLATVQRLAQTFSGIEAYESRILNKLVLGLDQSYLASVSPLARLETASRVAASVTFPDHFAEIAESLRSLLDPPRVVMLDELAQSASRSMSDMLNGITRSMMISPTEFDLSKVVPKWDIPQSFIDLVAARQGADALEEAGFGYTVTYWEVSFLRELAEDGPEPPSARILASMLSYTEGDEFSHHLQEAFTSATLKKRWPAVQEALESHRQRRYHASVATFLPQIEGIIFDCLLLAGQALQQGRRAYVRNPDGTRGEELRSLEVKGKKLRGKPWADASLVDLILGQIARDRNGILHGTDSEYGAAERSVHLALVTLFLAQSVEDLEEGDHSPPPVVA